ncbi:metallophosphoesterase [Sphingopyxis indica]|nr:metallophosphoesterase [Sphingopyxis indica]
MKSISKFFGKRKAGPTATAHEQFAVPSGQRVYAIGDIHGRDDLFEQIIDRIRDDSAKRGPTHVTLILLGDLVDRGAQSAAVVERAMNLRTEFPDTRLLIGNHEECFLAALTGDVRRVRYFMRIGGDATVRSYWQDDTSFAAATFEQVAERLPQIVPPDHVNFLGMGEDVVEIGDYAFVHAGIRPGVPLDKQALSDLRWIREEFLNDPCDHGKMVIHGHSITDEPDEQPNRIGIDVGAFRSGTLAALGLEGTRRWFLFASDQAAAVNAA